MSRTIAVTGAGGFLGWHLQIATPEDTVIPIPVGENFDAAQAADALDRADLLIHLAGANRGENVADLNVQFAQQLAGALADSPTPIVYAGTTQTEGPYGESKTAAAEILRPDRIVTLPNVFGEHGRPFYNSVVATFSHLLATGEGAPTVHEDRDLTLIHAQNAVDWLLGEDPIFYEASVSELLATLSGFAQTYREGHIPDISTPFQRDLFNTYRSFVGPDPIALTRHADERGAFFEIIRTNGGTGQSSFSVTVPGVTRGDHYHRRKIERFTVLSGRATIRLRRLLSEDVITYEVDGEHPQAIDMPTGWTHNITNTGDEPLYTSFWTNDLFDPANPDTIMEAVNLG